MLYLLIDFDKNGMLLNSICSIKMKSKFSFNFSNFIVRYNYYCTVAESKYLTRSVIVDEKCRHLNRTREKNVEKS